LGFLLPGIYVALQSYHYKVLPINFLVTLLSSIQGISFPPLIEILFVLFMFDILAEASARMPKLLGMALSIIGALVLGETTVNAGIISPPSIVVVAISSIMLFIVPEQVPQVSLLRIAFTIIGGISGFYGMLMCFIILTTYLISANGYGVPLLAPYAPTVKQDKQDAIVKRSVNNIFKRPQSLSPKNTTRFTTRGNNNE
jgi:spore germination protein KA